MPAARPSPRRLASIDMGSNVERNPTVSILALVYTRVPSERATELDRCVRLWRAKLTSFGAVGA